MRLHPRADDGIRTRDPHLGKVMRYQLRYIRAPRARSSPVAKDDDSPPQRSRTNPFRNTMSRAAFSYQRRSVLIFDVVPRSRSSGGERPPHTRKVTGSIPVGTTQISAGHRIFSYPISDFSSTTARAYPPSRSSSKPVERIRHTIQVGIVEIRIRVRGNHDRRVAHRHLQ